MELPIFTESKFCTSRRFCGTCRQRESGRAWRENIGKTHTLPSDAPDFACPHGVEWAKEKSRGLGDTIARLTKAVGIKPCGGCKSRQAALNKLVPYRPS